MLQLHSEQYYIKGGDRIGAFGINQFTEDENSKIKKDRRKKRTSNGADKIYNSGLSKNSNGSLISEYYNGLNRQRINH